MRVIAGKYKGRTLFSPKDESVRPTTDRIKENIFNLIQFRIAGASFLDLFGGSGAMSIEALSRGAARVVTVDSARESIALIKRNFMKVGIGKEGEILEKDYVAALSSLRGAAFDFIFLDPPYKATFYEDILLKIAEYEVLAETGNVIFEHATERALTLPEGLRNVDSRKYGSVTIDFLSAEKE
ncbi:MAG: 16S rRNA (guanine(966)-N(2))-methyltransferase RsmD [Clostridia bacterium]|nr:16S rRNA (guanine(966)-N(2))-methyltransferase RsmD [Clostridia bacterium]